ncbi:MAG TPA: putative S-layer protein [Nanoarchaeota archaeon]|nr:putative S-layer protein [Nanoarchaeota archaeon]
MNKKLLLGLVLALLALIASVSAQSLAITGITAAAGDPGSGVDVTVSVRNTGQNNISSILLTSTAFSLNSNSITAPAIEAITNLNAGAEQTRTFTVTLPALPAGYYNATLTAADASNASETASRAYGVTISPKANFEIAQPKVTVTGQEDSTASASFTIRNTGSTTLTSFVFSYNGTFTDNDLDGATFTFSSLSSLAPGAEAGVTVTADIERHVDLDTYTGTLKAAANSVEKTVPLELEVQPKMCGEGRIGNLDVTIEQPDDDETFSPGETIDITAEVDNEYSRNLNIVVEAVLYDLTENKDIESVASDSKYIDNGDSDSFGLELEIPSDDVDEDNDYVLYVKAYKEGDEDEQCDYEKVDITIEREDESVAITSFTVTPEMPTCTDTVTATVEVENTGLEDQRNAYIRLTGKAFGIDQESDTFSIAAYDEDSNTHSESFVFNVETEAEGLLVATVYYGGSEKEVKEILFKTGKCDAEAKKLMGEARLMLSMDSDKIAIAPGTKQFVLPLVVENKGGKAAEFTLDVTEASGWAEVTGIEVPASLGSGEQYHAYVYMKVKDSAAEGVHNFRINLRDAKGLIFSKMASADVQAAPKEDVAQQEESAVPSISKWLFADKNRLFWIAGDLVLVILALVFLKLLLRR